jgi:hypothetical protein
LEGLSMLFRLEPPQFHKGEKPVGFSSLIRASSVVNRQRTLASRRLRSASQAHASSVTHPLLSIRRFRLSQLPCLGVG